jgi:hypothetical protein
MSIASLNSRSERRTPAIIVFLAAGLEVFSGCTGAEVTYTPASLPPSVPHLEPGQAMVAGRVSTMDDQPVAGALITALEAGAQATTDGEGLWAFPVPGDSTVTLRVTADGLAPTLSDTMIIPSGGTGAGIDLLMVPPARIDQLNALGGRPSTAAGVVAVQVVSMSGACPASGGHVVVAPAELGRVVYTSGDDAIPDAALTEMQEGPAVPAWIAAAVPSGFYVRLGFQKSGCTPMAAPFQVGGRMYTGHGPIQAGALTQAVLFVE